MNRIKELRKLAGKSQVDLAEILHVNRTTLTKWETGKHAPDIETVEVLADYFHVSTDYILGRTDTRETKKDTSGEVSDDDMTFAQYDAEAVELMREMHERPELRALFHTSKKVKADDIRAVDELLKHMADGYRDD